MFHAPQHFQYLAFLFHMTTKPPPTPTPSCEAVTQTCPLTSPHPLVMTTANLALTHVTSIYSQATPLPVQTDKQIVNSDKGHVFLAHKWLILWDGVICVRVAGENINCYGTGASFSQRVAQPSLKHLAQRSSPPLSTDPPQHTPLPCIVRWAFCGPLYDAIMRSKCI